MDIPKTKDPQVGDMVHLHIKGIDAPIAAIITSIEGTQRVMVNLRFFSDSTHYEALFKMNKEQLETEVMLEKLKNGVIHNVLFGYEFKGWPEDYDVGHAVWTFPSREESEEHKIDVKIA